MKQRERIHSQGMFSGYGQFGVSVHHEHLSQTIRINLEIFSPSPNLITISQMLAALKKRTVFGDVKRMRADWKAFQAARPPTAGYAYRAAVSCRFSLKESYDFLGSKRIKIIRRRNLTGHKSQLFNTFALSRG